MFCDHNNSLKHNKDQDYIFCKECGKQWLHKSIHEMQYPIPAASPIYPYAPSYKPYEITCETDNCTKSSGIPITELK